ncbi:MAG: hypothetical protein EB084_23895 [Proteobacteria bacterium]|nr:hypothetical protein [Pseudomonadota bacterium]
MPLPAVGTYTPPADLRSRVGTADYYVARHADFVQRHPDLPPPDYYLEYGDKYMHRFVDETRPHMSDAGKAWVLRTRDLLQDALETERARDPVGFDRMECSLSALRRFCFSTHPKAYMDAGLAKLDPIEWSAIVLTPDAASIITPDGLAQIVDTAGRLAKERAQADTAALLAACPPLAPLGRALAETARRLEPLVEQARRDTEKVGEALDPVRDAVGPLVSRAVETTGLLIAPLVEPVRQSLLIAVEGLSDRVHGNR